MTYIVPHFRYGALIHLMIGKQKQEDYKQVNIKQVKIEKMFRITVKEVYDLPRSTPNIIIKKIMGN